MYSPVYLQEYSLFQLIQHIGNNMLHAQIHARSKHMTAHKSVPVARMRNAEQVIQTKSRQAGINIRYNPCRFKEV